MSVLFTFQYGEIKRGGDAVETVGIHEFTFQYGEIKRDCYFYTLKELVTIYIPVWRD